MKGLNFFVMTRIHFHKLRILFPLLGIFLCTSIYYFCIYDSRTDIREKIILENSVDENLKKSDLYYKGKSSSHLACIQPSLNIKPSDLGNVISTKDILVCDEDEDWVKVTGYEAVISRAAKKVNGKINCSFTELVRVDDDTTREGVTTKVSGDTFIFSSSDFYNVDCTAANGKRWKSTLAGIRNDQLLHLERSWSLVPDDAVKLNVLMLGFDSLSRSNFMRTLPKTFRFLTEELKSNVFEGYNIVGDGTPQALIPILTGKTELELPETRKRMGKEAQFVNVFPFIWKDFERNGYVTLFAEDEPNDACFSYRLKGFDARPTHHYMRPFYTHVYPSYSKHRNYCLDSTPRHKVFLKYLTDFYDVYEHKPKFAFAMHTELSHNDQNLISIADDDILESLKYLQRRGYLNTTVLVLFSDHGSRFSSTRATQQGKQEERLPFLSVYLPPRFRELYPSAFDNVRVNTRRLTTPFDLHPTLKDLVHFSGAKLGRVSDRGISLFSEIPPSRTCLDAFIEAHWCACLTWESLPVTHDKVIEGSKALVNYINSYSASHRSLCHEMKLSRIAWAALLLPNQSLINFRRTSDLDGFVPDFRDRTAITEEVYQITVTAIPSKEYFHTSNDFPMFEASLTYNIKQDSFSVKIDDISRINRYGDQPHCVAKSQPHLRKFCYCLEPP